MTTDDSINQWCLKSLYKLLRKRGCWNSLCFNELLGLSYLKFRWSKAHKEIRSKAPRIKWVPRVWGVVTMLELWFLLKYTEILWEYIFWSPVWDMRSSIAADDDWSPVLTGLCFFWFCSVLVWVWVLAVVFVCLFLFPSEGSFCVCVTFRMQGTFQRV